MNNKIDKFFKNKLSVHEMAPSPMAWDKIQGQLQSKKRKKFGMYYRIAAAVALVCISAFALSRLWNSENTIATNKIEVASQEKPIINEDDNIVNKSDGLVHSEQEGGPEIPGSEDVFENPSLVAENEGKRNEKNLLSRQRPEIVVQPQIAESLEKFIEIEPEILIAETANRSQEFAREDKNEKRPGITITYKKGNKPKTLIAEGGTGLSAENDHSPIKKFLKIAREIRESEIDLAEIRDSKEDLFALERIKQKKQ